MGCTVVEISNKPGMEIHAAAQSICKDQACVCPDHARFESYIVTTFAYGLGHAVHNDYLLCKDMFCPCANCNVAWNACGGFVFDDADENGEQMREASRFNREVALHVLKRLQHAAEITESLERSPKKARPGPLNQAAVPQAKAVNYVANGLVRADSTVKKDLKADLENHDSNATTPLYDYESLASSSEEDAFAVIPWNQTSHAPEAAGKPPKLCFPWKSLLVNEHGRILAFAVPIVSVEALKQNCLVRMQMQSGWRSSQDYAKLHCGVLDQVDSLFQASACGVQEHDIFVKNTKTPMLCRVFNATSMFKLFAAAMQLYVKEAQTRRLQAEFKSIWMRYVLNIGETPLKRIHRDFRLRKHSVKRLITQ